jgi:metal-responsive CopG/Arc/MetJ family transcriptional regulator
MAKSAPPKPSRERVKAFRGKAGSKRVDVTLPVAVAGTIDEIANHYQLSRNDVIVSMLRFALLNRNWKVYGVKT